MRRNEGLGLGRGRFPSFLAASSLLLFADGRRHMGSDIVRRGGELASFLFDDFGLLRLPTATALLLGGAACLGVAQGNVSHKPFRLGVGVGVQIGGGVTVSRDKSGIGSERDKLRGC